MARYLSDNCYCNGSLIANSVQTAELKATKAVIPTVEIEHVDVDTVQSDYVYGVTEVGGGHVEAVNTLSLANESIDHWQDLIDREYVTVPEPEPFIQYDTNPTFNKFTDVSNYSVLDVAQSAEDKNTLLALMTKDAGATSVLFESTNGGASWSYLFATPHFMTNVSPYFNASSDHTFGCFGQGYVYNYVLRGTHNEMTIAPIDYKNCLKTFPTITEVSGSYIISYYATTGTVCSSWNSLSAHAGCSGCVSGCQVRERVYNIKNDGTIVTFAIANCVNDSTYETFNVLSSQYTWTDIAYNINTDTIVCVSSSNKIAIFRHEVAAMTIPISVNYTTSSPTTALQQCLTWYGYPLMATNMNSDWKIMIDDMSDALTPNVTFQNIDDASIPGILFTYHYHPYFNTYTACIGGKGYSITQTNKTSQTVMTALLNIFYPIGAVYTSFSPTSPALLFGGKWQLIKNRFVRSGRKIEYINDIGGEETHTLTKEEMPAHTHTFGHPKYTDGPDGGNSIVAPMNTYSNIYDSNTSSTGGLNGVTQPHNNMPPFINTFAWRRYA